MRYGRWMMVVSPDCTFAQGGREVGGRAGRKQGQGGTGGAVFLKGSRGCSLENGSRRILLFAARTIRFVRQLQGLSVQWWEAPS